MCSFLPKRAARKEARRRLCGGEIWLGRISLALTSCPASAPFTRSEEHTSELQSLMRIPYAVFCLKQKLELLLVLCIPLVKDVLKVRFRHAILPYRRVDFICLY